jgi:uncharacterized membrane protein
MQTKHSAGSILIFLVLLFIVVPANAQPQPPAYRFKTIEVPGSVETLALGVNNRGWIVGEFREIGSGTRHGFVKIGAEFLVFDPPQSQATQAFGINDRGQISGWFEAPPNLGPHFQGFVLDSGEFVAFNPPGVNVFFNNTHGINNRGEAVGVFADETGTYGFIKNGLSFSYIPEGTWPYGINDAGQVVGLADVGGAFFLDRDHFSVFWMPGDVANTVAHGINNKGTIVGQFAYWELDSGGGRVPGRVRGFVKEGSTFHTVELPDSTNTTIFGINDSGMIVGLFTDTTGNHAFVGYPVTDSGHPTVAEVADGVR